MIFVDTSAIYALADRADANHGIARRRLAAIVGSGMALLTHNYIMVESLALLQHRLGLAAAVALQESSRNFELVWIDAALHEEAASRWSSGRRAVSFVDQVSFLVMQRRKLETALAFDPDFAVAGFRLYA